MKPLSLLVVFICLFMSTHAQQKNDSLGHESKRAAKAKQALGLSKKQSIQIKEVHQDYKSRLRSVELDNTLSKEQQKEKRHQLQKEMRQKTDSLLTPEQRIKARELIKEKRKNRNTEK
jgi:Spy/CpxP family protein refolding chaperone